MRIRHMACASGKCRSLSASTSAFYHFEDLHIRTSTWSNLRLPVYDVTVTATWHQSFLCMEGVHKMLLPPHRAYSYIQTNTG